MAKYADIIDVEVPGEALPGETVYITGWVKNLSSSTKYIMLAARVTWSSSSQLILFNKPDPVDIPGGATCGFHGRFTMANEKGSIRIHSAWFNYSDRTWYPDDETTKSISVEAPKYSFEITRPLVSRR